MAAYPSTHPRAAPSYGIGTATITQRPRGPDPVQIARRVVQVLDDPAWRPPLLPVVATQLLDLTRRPNVDYNTIAKLLSQDPALAAQLLRRANSSGYGAGLQIRTLRDAVARLGLNGIRNLALEVTLSMRVFKAPGYQAAADAMRRHAVATGYMAAIVCRYTPFNGPQGFLYGLLADVGLALGLVALGDCTRHEVRPNLLSVWPTLWAIHERVSARVASSWNLDAEIVLVVGHHHTLRIQNVTHPMAAVVLVAAELASELGASLSEPLAESFGIVVPTSSEALDHARATLNLSPRQLDLMRAEGRAALRDAGT